MKLFSAVIDFDPRLVSESVLRATRKEPTGNVLVYALIIPRQIPSIGSGMDGRVCVIIVFAISRLLERALM